MDDYRKLLVMETMLEDRAREARLLRSAAETGFPRPAGGWRRMLVAVTVLILGMLAWWGH